MQKLTDKPMGQFMQGWWHRNDEITDMSAFEKRLLFHAGTKAYLQNNTAERNVAEFSAELLYKQGGRVAGGFFGGLAGGAVANGPGVIVGGAIGQELGHKWGEYRYDAEVKPLIQKYFPGKEELAKREYLTVLQDSAQLPDKIWYDRSLSTEQKIERLNAVSERYSAVSAEFKTVDPVIAKAVDDTVEAINHRIVKLYEALPPAAAGMPARQPAGSSPRVNPPNHSAPKNKRPAPADTAQSAEKRIDRKQLLQENQKFLDLYGMQSHKLSDDQNLQLYTQLRNYQIKQANLGRQKLANYEGITDFFSAVSMMGGDLTKIGTIGKSLASIHKNFSLLTGGIPGMAIPQGLAALSPISAIIMGGLSIIGLFRHKKRNDNPLVPLMAQVRELAQQLNGLRQEMREHFQQVYRNQQKTIETIIDGVCHLHDWIDRRVEDGIEPVMYSLDNVSTDLNHIFHILTSQNQAISLREFETVIFKTQRTLSRDSGLTPQDVQQQLVQFAWLLELWLEEHACADIYNGKTYLSRVDSAQTEVRLANHTFSQTLFQGYKEQYLHGLIGYLAEKAFSFQGGELFRGIDRNKLINPLIWSNALETYLSIREDFIAGQQEYDKNLTKLTSLRTNAENTLAFIASIRKSVKLFELLFDEYAQVLNEGNDVLCQTLWHNSLEHIYKDIKKSVDAIQFAADEAVFTTYSHSSFPKVKLIYQALITRLENRRREIMQTISGRQEWLEQLLEDKDGSIAALSTMLSAAPPVEEQSKTITSIKNELKTPLMTFAQPNKQVTENYSIPLCIQHLLAELNIPPIILLAERLGIAQFDIKYEYHYYQRAHFHGHRQPNDQYIYSIKVDLRFHNERVTLYEFDCVGSLLDHEDTKHIPALLNEIHAFWYPNYNMHYGDGRYKPNGCGIATTGIMHATAIIGPFLGAKTKFLAKDKIKQIQPTNLQKLCQQIHDKIVVQISAIRQEGAMRLSRPNTDWTALQKVLDKGQATYHFLQAYLQLAGFDGELLQAVNQLDRQHLATYIKAHLHHMTEEQLAAIEYVDIRKLLPQLKERVLSIVQAAETNEKHDYFNSKIENVIKIWLDRLELFVSSQRSAITLIDGPLLLANTESAPEVVAGDQLLESRKAGENPKKRAHEPEVSGTSAKRNAPPSASEDATIQPATDNDEQRRSASNLLLSFGSPLESEQTRKLRALTNRIITPIEQKLSFTLNESERQLLVSNLINELANPKYAQLLTQPATAGAEQEFIQAITTGVSNKIATKEQLSSQVIMQVIEEIITKQNSEPSKTKSSGFCAVM